VSGGGGAADLMLCEDPLNDVRFAGARAELGTMHRSRARPLLASNRFGHADIGMPRLGLTRPPAAPTPRTAYPSDARSFTHRMNSASGRVIAFAATTDADPISSP